MKALVLENFNTPYRLKEVAKPVPGIGEVLVKIAASGINPLDLKIKAGQAAHAKPMLPAILGIDLAGVVEAVDEGVTTFKPGDEVYGMTGVLLVFPAHWQNMLRWMPDCLLSNQKISACAKLLLCH